MSPEEIVKKLDRTGDWIEYEPETIRAIEGFDELDVNKALALQVAFSKSFRFTNWRGFEKVVIALNNVVPDFNSIEGATPREIQKAIKIMETISDEKVTLMDDVIRYVAGSYRWANIVYCPFFPEVDKLLEETELKAQVREAWKNKVEPEDDAIGVQLSRLLAVKEV